jgi:molecular chaperone GrpE
MENEHEWITPAETGAHDEEDSADSGSGKSVAAPTAPQQGIAEAYEKLQADKKDLYDRLLRKQAEMDNFRKRTQKEKEDVRQYAAENLIRSLLPTLDGFERALQHRDPAVPAAFYQGMELIYRELYGVLERAGLTPIDTTSQIFDPYLHQAVETVSAPDRREHEIVEELQRGYRLKNKLLRPAIVKVATGGKSG